MYSLSDRIHYFFDDGLRFQCQQCGRCCTGEPGRISVSATEKTRIARFLGISLSRFTCDALLHLPDDSIRELDNGACYFYNQGCTIYPVRPAQCQTFPFWFKNLRSHYAWKQIARECPGIGQGPVYTREQILDIVQHASL